MSKLAGAGGALEPGKPLLSVPVLKTTKEGAGGAGRIKPTYPHGVRSLEEIPKVERTPDLWKNVRGQDDIGRIAKLTGLTPQEVARAKQHFMTDTHILPENGGVVRTRFEPNVDDVRIWKKAADGKPLTPEESDFLKRLMPHEYHEARYMDMNGKALEKEFIEHGLDKRLKDYTDDLAKRGILSPERAKKLYEDEIKQTPIVTPYRLAHIITHYEKAPNP